MNIIKTVDKSNEIKKQWEPITCVISLEPIEVPYMLIDDGFTYEKKPLLMWFQKKPLICTPMGFAIKNKASISGIYNDAVYKHNIKKEPIICPYTKKKIKDPIIVEEDCITYEHSAILSRIKETLCKHQPIRLSDGGLYFEIHCYSNKSLWHILNATEKDRVPFIMPPPKLYSGFDITKIYEETKVSKIVIDPYEYFQNINKNISKEKTFPYLLNIKYEDCYFNKGCFKQCVFNNCLFSDCVFKCCFCSKFKNCCFRNCSFINCTLRQHEFKCMGSSMFSCYISKNAEVGDPKNDGSYVKNCSSLAEIIEALKLKAMQTIELQLL